MTNQKNDRSSGIRLFHTADLHLGSPFSGLDLKASELRRRQLSDSFERAVSLALGRGCGAILIAGDLFDCGYADGETVRRTFDLLGSCGLPVVISPGNHDPYIVGGIYNSRSIPKNIHIFDSPEMHSFDLDELGIRVHGYAFESERYTADPLASGAELHGEYLNVLCAHGDIYSPISTYAPINPAQLESMGFDYVALGHVHKYSEPIRLGKTLVAYSGFPEGRSFDECGFGGALIVELSRGREPVATAERVILSEKRYLSEVLDVTGASNRGEITEAVRAYVRANQLGAETNLRLTLVGSVDPQVPETVTLTADELGLGLIDLRNETLPILGAEMLESDVSLRGALYRQLMPSLQSPDPQTRRIAVGALRMGLAALDGRPLTQ